MNLNISARQAHPFHLVDVSPWPILMSVAVLSGALGMVSWLAHFPAYLVSSLVLIGIIAIVWWRDVLREAKAGYHTSMVQRGILIGFLLFLLSEIMLFFSFFWGMLHSSLSPSDALGCSWPPVGIHAVNPWGLPL